MLLWYESSVKSLPKLPNPLLRISIASGVLGLAGAALGATCWPHDPETTAPLVLENRLSDSVRAVLRVGRHDREVPDTVVITEVRLAPGERLKTDAVVSLWELTSYGVPTSHPLLLAVYRQDGMLWETQLWAEGLRNQAYFVAIEALPPPPPVRRSNAHNEG
jgi:hypothetical protein